MSVRSLSKQFGSKVRNRNVRTFSGTPERPQGRFFDTSSYTSSVPAYTRQQNRYTEAKKTMAPAKPESGEAVYKTWHRSHEPYVVRQRTLFNPGQFGAPELDDRDLRTRQQLFKPRWGD